MNEQIRPLTADGWWVRSRDIEYKLPQHVLVPTLEEREGDDGVYWVARLPFFGLTAYGTDRVVALERIQLMLGVIARHHAEHVGSGAHSVESVTRAAHS